MLSLRILIIPLVILVAVTVLVQYANGNQRIVHVSELISDENFITSGENGNSHICCMYGNCSCNSLDHALTNLTSNVLINITTDVTLSSLIKVSDIENVTIIGHNNPTVNYKDFGRIHLNFCNNCIIQGITWDGCGSVDIDNHTESVLKLSNSSNITIDNCSFQYSKGQAVLLSEVTGDVDIDHCNFVHNNHYRGHGAAIHYSSSNVTNCHQLSVFTIIGCNFAYSYVKSLVYIENTISRHNINVTISYTKFCHNQGISVYAISQNIYLTGKNVFHNNTAKDGTAIHISDHSTVIFSENSDVTFTQNFAKDRGGTVFLRNHSNVIFDQNSVTVFNDNIATYYGGAIYSEVSSNITFKANCKVTFSNNSVKQQWRSRGGAMFSNDNCYITFEGNSSTVFSNNIADWRGGAMYSRSHIFFKGNSSTVFTNNTADVGGAMHSNSYILFEGNSSTMFNNNIADWHGGAISSYSYILFEGNSSTVFSNNIADLRGGAIYSRSYILFEGNSSTVFSNNIANLYGGATFSLSILFEGNSSTVFSNNIADWHGGAIYSRSYILFEGNSSAVFSNNIANLYGGATYSLSILFEGNSSTVFSNNIALDDGGAILSLSYILFKGNSSTVFSNNTAEDDGGAIASTSYIRFEGNSSTVFNNNIADNGGGAIATIGTNVSFEGFSTVVFRNNIAEYGGAVFANDHCDVIFSDNSAIKFANNKATFGATVFSNTDSKIIARQSPTVIFNDLSAKWCSNTCLPYTSQGDVTIDSNGIVWCSDKKSFICLSMKCYCNKLEDLLDGLKSNALVNITGTVTLSTVVELEHLSNISIIGYNNIIVICVDGGGLKLYRCSDVTIEGITWIGCGNYDIINYVPVIHIDPSPQITIQNCTFQHSLGIAISLFSYFNIQNSRVNIIHCNFMNNNNYNRHGAAIFCRMNADEVNINIINCNFSYNGNAKSMIYLDHNLFAFLNLNTSNFHNNQGVSVYLSKNNALRVSGNVLFENNVAENGAGMYISDRSTITFDENSNAKFINNCVDHNGAAIFLNYHSNVTFEQSSVVTFNDNKASNGTVYCEASSNVTFKANCNVKFSSNSVTQYGAAIYSFDNSHVTFTENSKITFRNNNVSSNDIDLQHGGTIYSENNGHISFEDNSFTVFSNNIADFGAAIFLFHNSSIRFKDQSEVMISNNIARSCGVLTSSLFSDINFNDNSTITYNSNTVLYTLTSNLEFSASAMCTFLGTDIIFSGHSLTTFINNKAVESGAVVFSESNAIMKDYSLITFNNNAAQYSSGGAFACYNNSKVTIEGFSNLTFNGNKASQSGGAIYSYNNCKITFKDNSTSTFINNTARNNGGAIYSGQLSQCDFQGNSTVTVNDNTADNGGAFHFTKSTISFKEASAVSFYNNVARRNGGTGYFSLNSNITIKGTTTLRFDNNVAEQNAGALYSARSNILFSGNSTILLTYNTALLTGGAILANDHSNITLAGNSKSLFISNEATQSGGAGYFNSHCNFIMKENAIVLFDSNRALQGGAVWTDNHSKLIFKENSTASFNNNLANEGGGAVKALNHSNLWINDYTSIKFTNNSAQYGGAIFLDTTAAMVNNSDKICMDFTNNIAKISGNSVYQDANQFCTSSCLSNRIMWINHEYVDTPPSKLKFNDPAICIDNDNDIQCGSYYVQNIMLGESIIIPVCVLDYYNQSLDSLQFLVQSETSPNYFISGPNHVLISSNTFKGISIIGNQSLSKSTNFSITITLNTALYSDWKQISVNLIIELSPCHPGFWQCPNSTGCECYNANDIMFCSDSNSTIKRGYWFGSVTGKPTVTFCPINYCNFTCCETSNGYYHLSPVRDNQCRSHRFGTACGSCEEGYTLSFDSPECVNVDSCTAGQTILVILLTVIYWIVMVTLVFAMMYYKVEIGYLYSITYYYSIVDILLSQNLQASRGIYLTISIISSFSKIIPQFLGELCLTTGMSGIDQQFIHYIHPSAVIMILVIITFLARTYRRISEIISRGIIHVICLLLLLSYTSIASTSLLLMRSLKFHGIDKIYTYLSPDIEYFYGRHLAYGIVALLCIVTIVLGLPLLLTFEPFLNHKINFIKIKPLLDQFQGCYKDKYRCFAGYYMICRLFIITIVIANSSNEFVANYLLTVVCVITELIHVTVKPYSKEILNKFDGIILHLIIFVAALTLLDDIDSPSVMTTVYALVLLPLLTFFVMTLLLHKDELKKVITHFTLKDELPDTSTDVNDNNEVPMREFHHIVDDSARKKVTVTICDT